MNTNDITIILLTGIGATAATDLWAIARRRIFGTPLPNFGFVGRWMAQLARGHFRPRPIAAVPSVRGERAIGWAAHYAIGVAFALLLPAFWGREWIQHPTLLPALMVGIATVAAPLFIMQPGMGSKPSATARVSSFVTHAVFGLGLYLTASALAAQLCANLAGSVPDGDTARALGAARGGSAHGVTAATVAARSNGMMDL